MPIVKCPKCKSRYDPGVDDALDDIADGTGELSLKVVCPACGQWLRLPEKEPIRAPAVPPAMLKEMMKQSRLVEDSQEQKKSKVKPAKDDEADDPPARRRRRDEDDDDAPPRSKRRDHNEYDSPRRERRDDNGDEGYEFQPSRRRSRDEDEEDDLPPRRKRRGGSKVRQVATPAAPMIWAILSILCPCAMVGIASSGIALYKANEALNDLPGGKKGRTARRNMKIARVLAIIGMLMSVGTLIIAVTLNLTSPK